MIGILANLAKDLRDIAKLCSSTGLPRSSKILRQILIANKSLFNSFVMNLFDLCLPASALKKVDMPTWFVGFAGVMSSLLSTLPIIDPTFRA